MAELTATFENGSNGATITTAGGEGAATPWDNVAIGGSNTITYDNSKSAQGSLSAKLAEAGDSGTINLEWTSGTVGTQTDYYGRLYSFISANPSSELNAYLRYFRTGGTGTAWYLTILTDGKLRLYNQADGTIGTTTSSVTTNGWIRVEWHMNHTSGDVEVRLYNTATSSTLTDSISANVGAGIGSDANQIRFSVGPLNHTLWFDAIVANATTWPGPVAATEKQTAYFSRARYVAGRR